MSIDNIANNLARVPHLAAKKIFSKNKAAEFNNAAQIFESRGDELFASLEALSRNNISGFSGMLNNNVNNNVEQDESSVFYGIGLKSLENKVKFAEGRAYTPSGKDFTGKIKIKNPQGDVCVLNYTDGFIRTSQKTSAENNLPIFEKVYYYSEDNKLKEVISGFISDLTLQKAQNSFHQGEQQIILPDKERKRTVFEDDKIVSYVDDFSLTPEGKQRALLSDEDIKNKAKEIVDSVFIEKNLPAPKIIIKNRGEKFGSSYNPELHTLTINPQAYKTGNFELEETVMHELIHCREAILRTRLPKEKVKATITDYLVGKVLNGENGQVLEGETFLGFKTVEPPKMSDKMKQEFIQTAKESLYTEGHILPFGQMRKIAQNLIENNPDFIDQFKNNGNTAYEKALDLMRRYCKSHHFRYQLYLRQATGDIDISKLPPLTSEEEKLAQNSLYNCCDTIEGNIILTYFGKVTEDKLDRYQFSPEEVLAQTTGLTYAINQLREKMNNEIAQNSLTPQKRAYFTDTIEKLELQLEYKLKGKQWYDDYVKSLNSPSDVDLAQLCRQEKKELDELKSRIDASFTKYMSSLVLRYKNLI